jgi:hypothetical protein
VAAVLAGHEQAPDAVSANAAERHGTDWFVIIDLRNPKRSYADSKDISSKLGEPPFDETVARVSTAVWDMIAGTYQTTCGSMARSQNPIWRYATLIQLSRARASTMSFEAELRRALRIFPSAEMSLSALMKRLRLPMSKHPIVSSSQRAYPFAPLTKGTRLTLARSPTTPRSSRWEDSLVNLRAPVDRVSDPDATEVLTAN